MKKNQKIILALIFSSVISGFNSYVFPQLESHQSSKMINLQNPIFSENYKIEIQQDWVKNFDFFYNYYPTDTNFVYSVNELIKFDSSYNSLMELTQKVSSQFSLESIIVYLDISSKKVCGSGFVFSFDSIYNLRIVAPLNSDDYFEPDFYGDSISSNCNLNQKILISCMNRLLFLKPNEFFIEKKYKVLSVIPIPKDEQIEDFKTFPTKEELDMIIEQNNRNK